MNHKSVNSPVVKLLSVVAAVVVLVAANFSSSYANGAKDKGPKTMTEEQVNVKYVGTNENSFVFHVEYTNPTNEKFSIIVKNDAGVVVYQQQFNDAHFSKNFRLPKEESEIHPTFVIRKGSEQVERSFVINTRLTENVEVTKL